MCKARVSIQISLHHKNNGVKSRKLTDPSHPRPKHKQANPYLISDAEFNHNVKLYTPASNVIMRTLSPAGKRRHCTEPLIIINTSFSYRSVSGIIGSSLVNAKYQMLFRHSISLQ